MDVTSWLAGLRVRTSQLRALGFENQELRKTIRDAHDELGQLRERNQLVSATLNSMTARCEELEDELLSENEKSALAVARVGDLEASVEFVKEQLKIYQVRLGLLPQDRQGQTEKGETKPLRNARVPFAVAQSRAQTELTKEYWSRKANAVDLGTGVAGVTEQTETVSDKEP